MDPLQHNESTWDSIARANDRWFQAVTTEELQAARRGEWKINITAQKPVPRPWLEPLSGKRVLCLAGAGGKQSPLLAALGAQVTVLDISQEQLDRDRSIAEREGLELKTIHGDMSDLSSLPDARFDLVLNPCSVCYCPEVQPVWEETFRVLDRGGSLISGMIQPVHYLFDDVQRDRGELNVRHKIPYCDLDLPEQERLKIWGPDRPLEFGHSLTDLIGGLIQAGFRMTGFYEDRWGGDDPLSEHIDVFFAVKMDKP